MSDSYCKQCRDSGRVDHGGMIIPCPLCLDRKNANTTTVISKTELTRLRAVESNANDLYIALDWLLKDYEGMCRKSFPPSANWKKRLVTAKAALRCYRPILNPIGDKK